MRRLLAGALALLLQLPVWGRAPAEPPLVVAAVQLHVDAATLAAPGAYEREIRRSVARATRSAGRGVDLVVFPEYTAALLALAGLGKSLAASPAAETLLARLREREPSLCDPADFFASHAAETERRAAALFGTLAAAHRVWIVAGTIFARDGGGGLRNRALVFGPDGRLAYTQDKVFLTEIESGWLRMSSGAIGDAVGFRIRGRAIRLTICRDTFESVWERSFRGADLWIDIKANGTAFTSEERESFARALPARLGEAGVPYGLTVCLTGAVLEFFWEGESSFLRADAGGVRRLRVARTATGRDLLIARVPPGRS